jgi:signal transduction histidine kinase
MSRCGQRIYSLTVAPIIEAGYVNIDGLDITYAARKQSEKDLQHAKDDLEAANRHLEERVQDELKKREKQQQLLIQRSKLESFGKLAAGIAHEINQPLAGISMGLDKEADKTVNVLFFKTNMFVQNELREYIHDHDMHGNVYFDDTIEQAIATLQAHPIDLVIVEPKSMADIRLVKYTSQYFPKIRIILSVERSIEDIISTIRNSQFRILHKPFALREFRNILKENSIQ